MGDTDKRDPFPRLHTELTVAVVLLVVSYQVKKKQLAHRPSLPFFLAFFSPRYLGSAFFLSPYLYLFAMCYLRPFFFPSPSLDSDPGSLSPPPLPTTARAFIFIARRIQHIPRPLASNCDCPRYTALSVIGFSGGNNLHTEI